MNGEFLRLLLMVNRDHIFLQPLPPRVSWRWWLGFRPSLLRIIPRLTRNSPDALVDISLFLQAARDDNNAEGTENIPCRWPSTLFRKES